MTQKEMTNWLKDEITMSGSVNITLTDAEYERICKKEIKELYTLYPLTVRKEFTVIPKGLFYTEDFRRNRKILFPECVISIGRFEEIKDTYMFAGLPGWDFSMSKCFLADTFCGSFLNLSNITSWSITWSVIDQMKTFNLKDIGRDWSEIDHTLLVTGHDPRYNVYCEMFVKVDPQELYEDPWVRKWISGKAKINVSKMIGTFQATLIGSVQVNSGLWSEEGKAEVEECKEYFKMLVNADHFFLTTPS